MYCTSSVRISDTGAARAGSDVTVASRQSPPEISIDRFVIG